jgi:beta-galactosidase
LYRALWRHQHPVDFLVPEQMLDEDLSKYKIIFLPLAYTLSREEGEKLRAFAAAGGVLFADLWCAQKDEHAMIYERVPGAGLDQVFGCYEEELVPISDSTPVTLRDPKSVGSSLPSDTRFEVRRYLERMVPQAGCHVVGEFEDGSPAILVNRYEKGRAVYVPALLGRAFDERVDEKLGLFFAELARWAGIRPALDLEKDPPQAHVQARLLRGAEEDTLILLNYSQDQVSCRLAFPHQRHSRAVLADLSTGEEWLAQDDTRAWKTMIEPRCARVWRIRDVSNQSG